MRDRQSSYQDAAYGHPHRGRFWPRRGRRAFRAGSAHSGTPRLGVDLQAHTAAPHLDLTSAARATAPFVRRLPWRRDRDMSYALARPRATRPHRMRLRWVLLIALAVQVVLAAAAVWAVNSSVVRHLRIVGTADTQITRTVAALPLTGCVIVRCDLTRDTHLVEALPTVAHASVRAIFPDTLVITLTPRTPALIWTATAGTLVLASDGVVLGPLASDPAYAQLNLPTVADPAAVAFSGALPSAGASLDAGLVNMAAQLRKGLASAIGNSWTLTYLANSGLVAVAPNGMQVLFGDARAAAAMVDDDASAKTLGSPPSAATVAKGVRLQLDAAHQILKALAGRGETASRIDLRWGAHPYIVPTSG